MKKILKKLANLTVESAEPEFDSSAKQKRRRKRLVKRLRFLEIESAGPESDISVKKNRLQGIPSKELENSPMKSANSECDARVEKVIEKVKLLSVEECARDMNTIEEKQARRPSPGDHDSGIQPDESNSMVFSKLIEA